MGSSGPPSGIDQPLGPDWLQSGRVSKRDGRRGFTGCGHRKAASQVDTRSSDCLSTRPAKQQPCGWGFSGEVGWKNRRPPEGRGPLRE